MFRATGGCLFFFLLSVAWSLPSTDSPIQTAPTANVMQIDPTANVVQTAPTANVIQTAPTANDSVTGTAESDNTRIVGGQAVQYREAFAYQVSLRRRGSHSCGGSLIDTQHILTASHCVVEGKNKVIPATELVAVVGDLLLQPSSTTTVSNQVKYIFTHEKYNAETLENDIALLRVSTNFTFTSYINKIGLSPSTPTVNTYCVVSGWGTLYEGAQYISNSLQYVEVPIWSFANCNAAYTYTIYSSMVCAGYSNGGKDSCQGDSGGPLVCNNALAGIVSFGHGCARPDFPGVYTDVSHYTAWIQTQALRSSSSVAYLNLYLLIACVFIYLR